MESKQTGLAHSLPLLPEHVRANSPVEFVHEYLYPSPEARDAFSFGLDYVLFTAASDSEDFGAALADAIPPSGQVVRPSAAYSELVDVLSHATDKFSIDWPDEPASRNLRNSTSGSLAALHRGSYRFSVICILRSPDPGNSHSPPAWVTSSFCVCRSRWLVCAHWDWFRIRLCFVFLTLWR